MGNLPSNLSKNLPKMPQPPPGGGGGGGGVPQIPGGGGLVAPLPLAGLMAVIMGLFLGTIVSD
jgi:hypothetical protein